MTTSHIINAYAVLHNVAVKCQQQLPSEEEMVPFEYNDPEPLGELTLIGQRRGTVIR